MTKFWDERYATKEYVYGIEPNDFFKTFIDNRLPGKLLLPAEGEGRNAVYAAKLGWSVTAFDISYMAKEKAMQLASENRVVINYQNVSFEKFETRLKFDLIGLFYAHQPSAERVAMHRQMIKFLRPRGFLVLESFSKNQINNNSGGPKDIDMLPSLEEIKKDFSSLRIVHLEETSMELDAGISHKGTGDLIRLLAQKK